MSDAREDAAELPVGAVDASGEPIEAAGITPPEQPAMVDEDGDGEINGDGGGTADDDPADDDLEVQGGE